MCLSRFSVCTFLAYSLCWWIFNTTYTFILQTHKIKRSKYKVWKIADCKVDVSSSSSAVTRLFVELVFPHTLALALTFASRSFIYFHFFGLQWMLLYMFVVCLCLIKYYIRNCERYPPLFSIRNAVFRALCCSPARSLAHSGTLAHKHHVSGFLALLSVWEKKPTQHNNSS